ncbi:MAG: beta-ketoacyl-[acyl-carrier-protein] synthase family protein [Desulfovibrio sp.]|jgi:3-oxoacyl-[acyl-carrier-protein] synthase-1|nr:beta-ketoacyl-[acyl-carrier-protein] synthase family protein [Desulfovibrio sp.]
MKHRVAITGLGIISCLGASVDEVADALYKGKSGIVADAERKRLGFASCLTGSIPSYTPILPLSRKQRKTMPDFAQWAAEACRQALLQADLPYEDIRNERSGVLFGCDSSALASIEQTSVLLEKGNTASLGSGLVFRSMTSCVTMNLSTLFGTQGACWTISSACSSSAHAVGQAADLIMLGRQDRMLCGGAQEINWQSMCSFDALGAFASREDSPHAASRPFDAGRDGLVPSGGSAVLLLERYDFAQKRRAKILGEVAGYGFSSDGNNISIPAENGLYRAMRMALTAADMSARDIEYVCAHATSTPVGDSVEAKSIASLFGEKAVPVSSTKSMTGHELWMSGAAQAVYSTIMAEKHFLAPNCNFQRPDSDSARLDIVIEARHASPKAILCNAAGFGGTNASLALRFPGNT